MKALLCGWFLLCNMENKLLAQFEYYNNDYYDAPLLTELGISFGGMNCLTDLGGKKGMGKKLLKDLVWKNVRGCIGFYVAATYRYGIAIRIESCFGAVQAADSQLKRVAATTAGRYERNLHFKSRIGEVQFCMEVHPFYFLSPDRSEWSTLSPYMIGGIGYFQFNPTATLHNKVWALQPLRTEGQQSVLYPDRPVYSLRQLNFPVGLGLRYEINARLNARLELVHRFLLTDYLDDVSTDYVDPDIFPGFLSPDQAVVASRLFDRQGEINSNHTTVVGGQRGNPNNKDAYFSLQLKLAVVFGRWRR